MTEITICPLCRCQLKENQVKLSSENLIEYKNPIVGRVKITPKAFSELLENPNSYPSAIIAGICKEKEFLNEDPPLINIEFIEKEYKNFNPPIEFEEKCYRLLKLLYLTGGKDNKDFELNSTRDFALAYSYPEEFSRIVDQLSNNYYISIRKTHQISGGRCIFMGVKLTTYGKEEVEKELPKMPMFGLVSQEIATGDAKIDEKINHARSLFFKEYATIEDMRSACESLSSVLEPIREDLKEYFTNKDVSDFFEIVNNYNIRHNKEHTKRIEHPEQLEWIFYSLLNTINTYTKLKIRLG
jgi:hypothetical protein